ncbi:hypothetical protein H0H87_003132 [Tephrocybe sp. NHM501043]|nr:hypothetical protein H0H87_003132 [Tephrocybe sp. NHM501043]
MLTFSAASISNMFFEPKLSQLLNDIVNLISTVFLNTSGAGKTRLVLEGLCQNWGFCFTCKRQSDEIGSSDLRTMLANCGCLAAQGLITVLPNLPQGIHPKDNTPQAQGFQDALRHNETIGSRCFIAALYTRFLVFACFLKAVLQRRSPGKLDIPALRKTWLLMQTDMRLLLPLDGSKCDLFDELSGILCTIKDIIPLHKGVESLQSLCEVVLSSLDAENSQIYCVIDEAQAAVDAFPEAFRNGNLMNARPALRSIIFNWVRFEEFFPIIVTGTSLNRDDIVEALSSIVAKHNHINAGVTGTGSWVDTPDNVKKYLAKYLPPSYLDMESGKMLVSRASYWLYGRVGYHRLLTRCISSITNGFVPLDGQVWEKLETEFDSIELPMELLSPFDLTRGQSVYISSRIFTTHQKFLCSKLAASTYVNNPTLMRTIQEMTYERLWTGNISKLVDRYQEPTIALVECGFARFPGAYVDAYPIIDEPLAYISAEIWLNKRGGKSSERHAELFKAISMTSLNYNAFERYTALCLAHTFKDLNLLSNIFTFVDTGINRNLYGRSGRLVSCWADDTGFHVAPKIITVALRIEYKPTYDTFSREVDIKKAFRNVTPVHFWQGVRDAN